MSGADLEVSWAKIQIVITYIVEVMNWAASEDVGVENELRVAFQRLAKYPGVEEKDLNTLELENELAPIPGSPESSFLNVGVGWGIEDIEEGIFSTSSDVSTCSGSDTWSDSCEFITWFSCVLTDSSSCELMSSSPMPWLLLKFGADAGSEDRAAKPPMPNAAISCGNKGRDFRLCICLRFWNHIC